MDNSLVVPAPATILLLGPLPSLSCFLILLGSLILMGLLLYNGHIRVFLHGLTLPVLFQQLHNLHGHAPYLP